MEGLFFQYYPVMDNIQKWATWVLILLRRGIMITYEPLWRTMKEKNISQYRLIKYFGLSSGQINRLRQNEYVSTHTIGVLCTILNCNVSDIMEFHMDNSEYAIPNPKMYQKHILDKKKTADKPKPQTEES